MENKNKKTLRNQYWVKLLQKFIFWVLLNFGYKVAILYQLLCIKMFIKKMIWSVWTIYRNTTCTYIQVLFNWFFVILFLSWLVTPLRTLHFRQRHVSSLYNATELKEIYSILSWHLFFILSWIAEKKIKLLLVLSSE